MVVITILQLVARVARLAIVANCSLVQRDMTISTCATGGVDSAHERICTQHFTRTLPVLATIGNSATTSSLI